MSLRAVSAGLALVAVLALLVAIAGMVTDRQSARTGWIVRVLALVCFGAAVALNVAAH